MSIAATKMGAMDQDGGGGDRTRSLLLAMAICVVSLAAMAVSADTPVPFLGWYGLSSLASALLVVTYRPGSRSVAVVLVAAALLVAGGFAARNRDGVDPFQRDHDGGVVATEAAAEMARSLENPYVADFSDALAPHHDTLEALDAGEVVNPLVEHYPYLPAAFLVQVPSSLLGPLFDARIVYVAAAAAALAVVALAGPAAAAPRTAAVVATIANLAIAVYLPWGANDTAAAALVVLAAFLVPRRPLVAGALLALGISMKALLVVALLPLGALWLATHRREGLRAIGSTFAVLVATCAPYFLASPGDFVDDTIRFNLGTTDLSYPTSGIGLGAMYPDTVQGPLLLGLSLLLLGAATVAALWWVRRAPHVEVALFGAGLIVFAGLLPARSFQISYLALFAVLWGPVWRLGREEWAPHGAHTAD